MNLDQAKETLKAAAISPLLAILYAGIGFAVSGEVVNSTTVPAMLVATIVGLFAAYAFAFLFAAPLRLALQGASLPWAVVGLMIAIAFGLTVWGLDVTFGEPHLSEHEFIYPGPISGVVGFIFSFPIALFFAYLARDR